MHLAAGQAMDEPAVDGADAQGAAGGGAVDQPLHLGAGEHGVDRQTGDLQHAVGMAGGDQRLAFGRGAAALPAEDGTERLACFAIPDGDGFALVGDGDGFDADLGAGVETLGDRFADGGPDAVRVLLHPAGPGIADADRGCAAGKNLAALGDENGLGIGGALVDRKNGAHGRSRLPEAVIGDTGKRRTGPVSRFIALHAANRPGGLKKAGAR